ncbi:hypothetical protein TSMEX_002243, partial [Taenia solium]
LAIPLAAAFHTAGVRPSGWDFARFAATVAITDAASVGGTPVKSKSERNANTAVTDKLDAMEPLPVAVYPLYDSTPLQHALIFISYRRVGEFVCIYKMNLEVFLIV